MAASNKHFIESVSTLVTDSLEGICSVNPQLAFDRGNKTVYVKDFDRAKVTLMCGGGSGHEPAHAGFVGRGILTAAVCGNVFASPSSLQVRRGIDLISSEKGTVIIVKNYTGDVLNFGLAKEKYAASNPERSEKVKFVVVGDDVSVGREQGSIVGRRGLAGTVLVYKIAGALAERGASLDEVYQIATWVAGRLATIGVSLGHTHVPGTAHATSHLSLDEIEIGMGIHNEPGYKRTSPIPKLSELISELLSLLTSQESDRAFVPFAESGNEVVVLVNNLGGLSQLELGGIVKEAKKELDARGFTVQRLLSGTFMTSLNMPGFSLTLLLLPLEKETNSPSQKLILDLLDDKAETLGWSWSASRRPSSPDESKSTREHSEKDRPSSIRTGASQPDAFIAGIRAAAKALVLAEPEITRMDCIAGDGDCGLTLKAGAEGVLAEIDSGGINPADVVSSIIAISHVAENAMGGTSGALYSIFFSSLAQGIQSVLPNGGMIGPMEWAQASKIALDKLYTYTQARPPSRTLIDPLAAFVEALVETKGDIAPARVAATKAAENTQDLVARAGRSAYIRGDLLAEEHVSDPGAWGVKVIVDHLTSQ